MAVRIPGLSSTAFRSGRNRGVNRTILSFSIFLLLVTGCGGRKAVVPETSQPPSHQAPQPTPQPAPQQRPQPKPRQRPEPTTTKSKLARMGYSIQAGAFSNLGNAIRLTESLERQGLSAYYFRHKTGLYKVRFGDYSSKEAARATADRLKKAHIVRKYYIVTPDDYALAKERVYGREYFRNEIVETAERFIGLPYRWGGSSANTGFDCSGLTMAVYHMNGLNLPRSSSAQYRAGDPVRRSALDKGDLVFFATSGGKRVSHVGVYAGGESFIHAPGKGKTIRMDSLYNRYYAARYMGARTYLK
ncbi:MAG: NlpC/P60 family protein [Desulfobacteraceae bacterium]